jgi:hypothetical protein
MPEGAAVIATASDVRLVVGLADDGSPTEAVRDQAAGVNLLTYPGDVSTQARGNDLK